MLDVFQWLCAHNFSTVMLAWSAGHCQNPQVKLACPLGCEEQERFACWKPRYLAGAISGFKTLRGDRGTAINVHCPPNPHRDPQTGAAVRVCAATQGSGLLHWEAASTGDLAVWGESGESLLFTDECNSLDSFTCWYAYSLSSFAPLERVCLTCRNTVGLF